MEVARTDPIHVDLEHQTVTTRFQDRFQFEIDPFRKHCLLGGLDEIGLTLGQADAIGAFEAKDAGARPRSEEHTSELQSQMRNSYAVFCLKKKNKTHCSEFIINVQLEHI